MLAVPHATRCEHAQLSEAARQQCQLRCRPLLSQLASDIDTRHHLTACHCCAVFAKRIGKRVTGPAVSFTSDVLLPTTFFGPSLAAYILLLVICKVG